MKIDFNGVRLHAVRAYSALVKELEMSIDEDNRIVCGADDISDIMNDLRRTIGDIACSYLPDNPDIQDLTDKIGTLPVFNNSDN